YGDVQSPTFVAGNKLVYKRSVKGPAGAGEFVLVDIATTTKSSPFDHAKLATALSSVAGVTYTALTLPFNTYTYVDDMKAIQFVLGAAGGGRAGGGGGGGRAGGGPTTPPPPSYKCTLTDYTCTRLNAPSDNAAPQAQGAGQGRNGGGRAGGQGANANAETPTFQSPDGKYEAFIQNHNIFLRPLATAATGGGRQGGRQGGGGGGGRQAGAGGGAAASAATPVQLSWDGSE